MKIGSTTIEKLYETALNGLQKNTIDQEILDLLKAMDIPCLPDAPEITLWKAISTTQTLKLVANPTRMKPSETIEISAKERLEFCQLGAAQIIGKAVGDKHWNLVEEGLLLLQALKKRLHPIAIPFILNSCRSNHKLWPLLDHALGERALWAAAQRKEWQWWPSIMQCESPSSLRSFPIECLTRKRQIGSTLEEEDIELLSTSDRKRFLELVCVNPTSRDIPFLSEFQKSRGAQLRRKSLNALLHIIDSQPRKDAIRFGTQYFKRAIKFNRKKVVFDTDVSIPFQELNFKMADLEGFKQYFSNPLYRLLSYCSIDHIFQQQKQDIQSICQQIVQQESLDKLCQIVVLSCTTDRQIPWIKAMSVAWMTNYPEGNTIGVDFGPLLEILPPDLYNDLILKLINEEEQYFLELLSILMAQNKNYLTQQTSKTLLLRIIKHLKMGTNYGDSQHLKRWLKKGALVLDPRSVAILNTQWSDLEFYYDSLGTPMLNFKRRLQKRHDLFVQISKE